MSEGPYTYTKKTWKNYPDTSTPLNADNLQYMDDGIAKAHERLDAVNETLVIIDGEQPGQQNLMMYSGAGHTIEDSGINYRDVVIKTDLNNYATRAEMYSKAELSGEVDDNEVIIGSSPDVLIGSGVFLNNLATVIDYGATKFTLTNTEIFQMLHQHIYQIGSLVFVHLVFQTNKTLTDSMLYELGQLDIPPMHNHSFTVVPANPGVDRDLRVDPGYISIDGKVFLDVTESYSSSNYTFDITTFYCTDMTVDTPTD